jgi:amino acid transporter
MQEQIETPRLRRVLGLRDLIFYGIVLVQPIGAIGIFGIASGSSHGHVVTTLLIAMTAMMLTAVSYGRMASLFPSAGSAYTYVGRGLNIHLGFLAGWAMFLDYLIVPVINTVYGSLTLQRLFPGIPYFLWVALFVFAITYLNLRGIRTTARSNNFLLAIMVVVIGLFILFSVKFIVLRDGLKGLFSYKPFYNPDTFDFRSVMTATSLAALTYIGFDGVTTLAEDVKNARRNMMLAPAIVCVITGLFGVVEIYLAQLAWPDFDAFLNPETAFYDVSKMVGGNFLFNAVAAILFVACLGSGLTGQVAAARLLFAMGRDDILPKRIFGSLSGVKANPVYNILILGILTIVISMLISYRNAAELLNFGAFLAFMGVNLAAIKQFWIIRERKSIRNILLDLFVPAAGFFVCFLIWISLPSPAKITGGIWFLAGLVYLVIRTGWFTKKPSAFDFTESSFDNDDSPKLNDNII